MVQAAKSALEGICHYPQPDCIRLRQAVAELEHVKAEQILCGNGAAEIIFTLVLACKPKKALLVVPTFQEYEHALRTRVFVTRTSCHVGSLHRYHVSL